MIDKLTDVQIKELLYKEVIGRIGSYANNRVYVVPISYAFDGKSIYAHTNEGLKIDMMRTNPDVCFEVDDLKDLGNWQSVIAWGKYKELKERDERSAALTLLLNRELPVISSITTHLGKSWPFFSEDFDDIKGVVFKIELTEWSGKFETTSQSPVVYG